MDVLLCYAPSPPDDLGQVREDLELVCKASEGALPKGELFQALLEHRCQLWLIRVDGDYAGVLVTECLPNRINVVGLRVVPSYARDGVFDEVLSQLHAVATEYGLDLTGLSARTGMGRHLARLGWRQRLIEYVAPRKEN